MAESKKDQPKNIQPPGSGLNDDFLLNCAAIFSRFGQFHRARQLYLELLKKNSKNEKAYLGLGRCLFNSGQWEAASKCFEALVLLKAEAEGILWLGASWIKLGKLDQAKKYFDARGGLSELKAKVNLDIHADFPSEILEGLN